MPAFRRGVPTSAWAHPPCPSDGERDLRLVLLPDGGQRDHGDLGAGGGPQSLGERGHAVAFAAASTTPARSVT